MKRNTITKHKCMESIGNGLIEIERFKSCLKTFIIQNKKEIINYEVFFSHISDMLISMLKKSSQQSSIKFNCMLIVRMNV